jgi:hypothetical protein
MSQVERESSRKSAERGRAVPALVYPYTAGLVGGALGGLAMIVVALFYGVLTGRLWLPVNLIGATLVRDLQNAPLAALEQFNAPALIVGLLLHAALSVGLGFVFALLLPTLPGPPIVWSLTIGPLLWGLASLITLPLLNPVMARHVDAASFFVAHLVYGVVLGWSVARSPKIRAG